MGLMTLKPGLIFLVVALFVGDAYSANKREAILNCKDFYNLHDCDPVAECVRNDNSYAPDVQCRCPSGHHDMSPDVKNSPGRVCKKPVNECNDPKLNDCDKVASCVDRWEGYTCTCPATYLDSSPPYKPGRVCVAKSEDDECSKNPCPANADCTVDHDTYQGFRCRCKAGLVDASPNPQKEPGRVCNKPVVNKCSRRDLNTCHKNAFCISSGDTYKCVCQPGFKDTSPNPNEPGRDCQPQNNECTDGTNDCAKDGGVCVDTPDSYTCHCAAGYMDISVDKQNKPGRACKHLVNECASPELNTCDKNALCIDLQEGYECQCKVPYKDESPTEKGRVCNLHPCGDPKLNNCDPNAECIETKDGFTCACKQGFFDTSSDPKNQGRVCSAISIDDVILIDKRPECGKELCNPDLGEICIEGKTCGCMPSQGRLTKEDKCVNVTKTPLVIRVGTLDQRPLIYSSGYDDNRSPNRLQFVDEFKKGVGKALESTVYGPRYIATDISRIGNPRVHNSSWNDGLLVNFTVNTIATPEGVDACDVWKKLMESVKNSDGAIGGGRLKTAADVHMLNPCLRTINECEDKSLNQCSENARCIDLEILYKCECLPGYLDASAKGTIAGSVCKPDFCYDVHHCTINSTCINLENGYKCECKKGFVDISQAPGYLANNSLAIASVDDNTCIATADVDMCVLGLHNCSGVAKCIRKFPTGYTCQCPADFQDMDKENPGRVCAAAQCGLCNNHGACIHDPKTNNVTCQCDDGYYGEHCELVASVLPLLIPLILALLFLLLTLCCLLYLCSKLRWFKRARAYPWNALDNSVSSDSALYDDLRIPRAHLYDAGSIKSGDSDYTIREEIERVVTTDITRTELTSTEANDEVHEAMDTSRAWTTHHEYNPDVRGAILH